MRASSEPDASFGWTPTIANTSSFSAARSFARTHDSVFIPIVAIRDSPASRARSSAPSSHMSRWQWVSTIYAREEGLDLRDGRPGPLAVDRGVERPPLLADRVEQLRGGVRNPRMEQERQHAQ